MIHLLLGIAVLFPSLPVQHGYLSQYGKGPTDGTIAYRQTTGELPQDLSSYDGFIAVVDCDLIGKSALLSIEGGPWLHVGVIDCSGHVSTTRWMQESNIIAELDYYTTRDYGFLDKGDVEARLMWPLDIEPWLVDNDAHTSTFLDHLHILPKQHLHPSRRQLPRRSQRNHSVWHHGCNLIHDPLS